MPSNPIDYSKAFIYKIVCNDITIPNLYIGSSCNFIKRKCQHKTDCNNENTKSFSSYKYQFIRDNGGWDNFSMLKIIDFPCNDRYELEIKERYYIELLKSDLNKNIPTRTIKEYYENNKDKIKDYYKEYNETNKDHIKERHKEYREVNKDKIKEYYESNKDKLKEQSKEYYEVNKTKIKERNEAIIICSCGSLVQAINKSRHNKSVKHINHINQTNEI